jgi:dienelactone hydrolase
MLKMRLVAAVMMAGTLVLPAWDTSTQTMAGGLQTPPIVTATEAPAGTETLRVKWVRVAVPKLGVMRAAVARPSGTGPFPAVLILHGTHGFARQYVEWANDLARGGFIAVAACWFSGGGGAGAYAVTPPIPCPEIPPLGSGDYPEAVQFVNALAEATRALPAVRADRLALVGHSRGGGAVLQYLLAGGNVQAAILHSSTMPYDRTPVPESSKCRFRSCMARLNLTAAEAQITMSHWRVTSKRRCGGIRKQSRRVITKEEATTASSST